MSSARAPTGHEKIETNNFLMIVLILLVVAVGGIVEIVPLFFQRSTTEPAPGLKPYTALQLAGRDIYIREGCYNCHSQMIRSLQRRTLRYGHYSMASEFVYDHPFQWGSKRTGPDLHRVGGKYSDEWHRAAPEQPARPGARVEHAGATRGCSPARSTTETSPPTCAACAGSAFRTPTPRSRLRRQRARQGRDRRADRLSPGARHLGQVGGMQWMPSISFGLGSPCSPSLLHGPGGLGLVATQPRALRRSGAAAVRAEAEDNRAMNDFLQRLVDLHRRRDPRQPGGCLVLLAIASRRIKMSDDNSTGHVFDDDLVEMNNPLPLWWMVLFVLTVLFAFGYVYAFPALGGSPGALGWSSAGELRADQAAAKERAATVFAAFAGKPVEALARDPKAMEIGQRLFLNNCSNCHGSDARGSKGFPNLTDNDWLHGGTPENIEESITNGRIGMMPPMAAAVGSPADVHDVANYVMSLSGDPHDSIAAAAGKKKFVVCAGCHGADGKGNQIVGAPNLTDKIWLHGWGEAAITSDGHQRQDQRHAGAEANASRPSRSTCSRRYVWNLSQPQLTASK